MEKSATNNTKARIRCICNTFIIFKKYKPTNANVYNRILKMTAEDSQKVCKREKKNPKSTCFLHIIPVTNFELIKQYVSAMTNTCVGVRSTVYENKCKSLMTHKTYDRVQYTFAIHGRDRALFTLQD